MKQHIPLFNYAVNNQNSDKLVVNIDGYIVDAPTQEMLREFWGDETSVSFKSVRDQIRSSKPTNIEFIVNSGGGHVGDAMAIYDLIQDLKREGVNVKTKGTGIVASAATYVVMAGGDNSEMTENSWFMIHNVSGGIYGDVNVIENYARTMRKFNDTVVNFYASTTGLPAEEVSGLMNKETWLTANEAKEKGFVKNVSGQVEFTNAIKPELWPFENTAVLNAYNKCVAKPADNQQSFFSELKNDIMKFFNTMKEAINNGKQDTKYEGIENRAAILDMVQEVLTPLVNQLDEAIKEEANANGEGEGANNNGEGAGQGEGEGANANGESTPNAEGEGEETVVNLKQQLEKEKAENEKLRNAIANKTMTPAPAVNGEKKNAADVANIQYAD